MKAVILDQSVVSGLETSMPMSRCGAPGFHWQRLASDIPATRLRELLDHSRDVMTEARCRRTSFDSLYVNVNGSSGYFSRSLVAYGREGEPCPRCGTPLVREQFANRSSFRCPRCQRPARRTRDTG